MSWVIGILRTRMRTLFGGDAVVGVKRFASWGDEKKGLLDSLGKRGQKVTLVDRLAELEKAVGSA